MIQRIKFCHQINETECGLCCVSMLLSYFESYVTLNYLRERVNLGRDGISFLQIVELLGREGIQSNVFEMQNISDLSCDAPMIVLDENRNHFAVIKRIKNHLYVVYDPEIGKYKLAVEDILENFSYYLIPAKTENFIQKKISQHYWKYFLAPIRKNGFDFFKLLVLSTVVYFLTTSVTFMIQKTIDDLNRGIDNSNSYLVSAVLISLAYLISSHFRNKIFIEIELKIDKFLNISLFKKVLELPFSFFNSRGENEILYRMNLLGSIRSLISNGLVNIILDGGTVVFLLFYIFVLNYLFGIAILILSIITIMYIITINRRILLVNQVVLSEQSKLLKIQMELVKTLEYLKITGSEKSLFRKFSQKIDEFLVSFKKGEKLSFANSLILNFLSLMSPFILLYSGSYLGLLSKNTVGEKVILYFISSMIISKETALFQNFTSFELIKNILERVNDIYDAKSEIQNSDISPISTIESLVFKNVAFTYSDNSADILSDLNFEIRKGDKVAFVGETGSGKSTILKLLSGLYKPKHGSILVNGQNLSLINLISYRKSFSYIPQNIDLMDDTIYNNLLLDRQYDSGYINQCLEYSELKRDVDNLPLGLNTRVSSISNNLSGGQKQRIAIARAMLYRGEILLSDEGTSSLDFITENKIMKSLDKQFETQVIVAHRLSTIKNSDKIFFLQKGKIIEYGTHEELYKQKGAYYQLYIAQENTDQKKVGI